MPSIVNMPDLYLIKGDVLNFSDGWTWRGDQYENKYSLPYHFNVGKSETLVIGNTLPDDLPAGSMLAMKSVANSVVVKIDGETIYEMGNDREKFRGRDLGTFWAFMKIEPQHMGREIEISLFSNRSASHGVAYEIFIGSEGALYGHLFMQKGLWNLFAPITIILGLTIILVYFFFGVFKEKNRSLLYLGLFAFIMGNWFLGESQMLQLLTNNAYFALRLTHLMTLLAPIVACLYLRETVPMKKRFFTDFLVTLAIINSVVTLGLEYMNILGLPDTINMTMVLILIICAYYIVILILESFVYKNERAYKELKLLSIIFIFGIAEIVAYFINGQQLTSNYLHVGVSVYIALMIKSQFKYYLERKKIREERDFFEQRAYIDALTGANNRARYMDDIDKITQPEGTIIVQADTDRLKYINDFFGHFSGDQSIVDTFEILNKNFLHLGTVYRTGGDEFTVIIENAGIDKVNAVIEKIRNDAKQVDQKREYDFSMSLGVAEYDASLDKSVFSTTIRADHKMYDDKKRLRNTVPAKIPDDRV